MAGLQQDGKAVEEVRACNQLFLREAEVVEVIEVSKVLYCEVEAASRSLFWGITIRGGPQPGQF